MHLSRDYNAILKDQDSCCTRRRVRALVHATHSELFISFFIFHRQNMDIYQTRASGVGRTLSFQKHVKEKKNWRRDCPVV